MLLIARRDFDQLPKSNKTIWQARIGVLNMGRLPTGDSFELLTDERVELRIKISLLEERGGNDAELLLVKQRLDAVSTQLKGVLKNRYKDSQI